MNILISGGGIGGLTAALCLLKSGHKVKLLEQSPALSEVGAGVQCGANALRVLDYLGLLPELENYAVSPIKAEFCDYQTAELIHSIDFGEAYQRRYRVSYYHLHRADLQAVLLQALIQCAPDCLYLNAKLETVKQSAEQVSVTLADGRTIEGDCLIAADGIHSVVRQQLFSQAEPIFSGSYAWRAVIPTENLPNNFMPTVVRNYLAPNKHLILYYLRRQQLLNLVGVVDSRDNQREFKQDYLEKAPWLDLQNDFSGWHSDVQTVINQLDQQACYRWPLYQLKPLANWSANRVTLLGDAAHACLPYTASGAAMAIEDARILQRAIDESNDLPQALQIYQQHRQARTRKIQRSAELMGKLYHHSNKTIQKAGFYGLKLSKASDFLPVYNANTVEIW